MNCFPTLNFELLHKTFAGVDEVGRGCLAGPVVAAAVVLDPKHIPAGINDSKKLTPQQREVLSAQIISTAKNYYVSAVGVEEIDQINILQASKKAMHLACCNLINAPAIILVDGIYKPIDSKNYVCIKNGDALSTSIAAASIIAKVARDKIMTTLHTEYPKYNWQHNKGYGTKEHVAQIIKHGTTPHHRKSFNPIKTLLLNQTIFCRQF